MKKSKVSLVLVLLFVSILIRFLTMITNVRGDLPIVAYSPDGKGYLQEIGPNRRKSLALAHQ